MTSVAIADSAALLAQHFGFDAFKPGQQAVVDHLLAGRSAAAVFPTGGGKSLCYQLPAMALPGVTLVVSPLIALMKDQIDALATRGIAAIRLDSTLDADGYRNAMDRIRRGEVRLLYVSPERFANERFRQVLSQLRVSLFAIDEAHCISEWGHNFRPDYLKLAGFARDAKAERVLALTATATEKVLGDIREVFDIAPECAIRTGFYRPNLTLLLTSLARHDRDAQLLARLRAREPGPTIVYVTLQKTAERVARDLASAGFPAHAYHAGMEPEERSQVQDRFIHSDRGVVVATIAFGMGIDKADIRYVYHYNLPKSLENYSQEIGRAGRNGEPAICETFACPDDLGTLENFIFGDTPTLDAVQALVRDVFGQGESFDLSHHTLSSTHDLRMLVARTLLTYLELLGYLEGGTPFYATYRFKPLIASKEILASFQGERREFLAALFKQAGKAKVWFDVDVDAAAHNLQTSRERIITALDYLDEQQMLTVEAAGVRHRYRVLEQPQDLAALAKTLHDRTREREGSEVQRLKQVVELVELDACQVAALGAYFGDPCEPCGHCSWCLNGRTPAKLPARPEVPIDEGMWGQLDPLRRSHPEILSDPRAVARFLCGIATPWLTKAKLTRDPLFARLQDAPFAAVLREVEGRGAAGGIA
jgi:ATP-dependent DNA helicase RecQ